MSPCIAASHDGYPAARRSDRIYELDRLLTAVEQLKQRRTFSPIRDLVVHDQPPPLSTALRCDVEREPHHHLRVAEKLAAIGVRSTMYVHTRRDCFIPAALRAIQDLGHEVGFHHECLARCDGDAARARELFLREVELFRRHGLDIDTVCSHGESGLPKRGYRTNYDLFLRYPDLLREAGITAEIYLWRKGQELYSASDTFSARRRFWSVIAQGSESDRPLIILVHLHRWHRARVVSVEQIMRDVRRHVANRIIGTRTYDVVE